MRETAGARRGLNGVALAVLAFVASGCGDEGHAKGGSGGGSADSGAFDSAVDYSLGEDAWPTTPPDAGPCRVDGSALDCSYLDGPCRRGVCDPETGGCTTLELDGAPCDDGDACTVDDVCVQGECVAGPLGCAALGTECSPLVCDADAGACVAAPVADGTACDDGTACSTASECRGGLCLPTAFLDCSSVADECNAGACDAQVGCVPRPLTGAPCDDGDGCTTGDACSASGVCEGTPLDCAAAAGPCRTGTCDAATGTCQFALLADGTVCDDGDACTGPDRCAAGVCTGATVSCPGADECHTAGCDHATGCTLVTDADGSPCDDSDPCTSGDRCTGGVCAGTALACGVLDDECNTGVCDPTQGVCVRAPKPDGTDCDADPADCTTDSCAAGTCVSANVAECTACGAGGGLKCRSGVCDTDTLSEAEGFESSGLPPGYSTGAGAAGWSVTAELSVEGAQSMRSGAVGDGQTSEVSRTVFSTWLVRIDFAFRVSTEESNPTQPGDNLIFLVDDVEVQRWSGVRPWGRFETSLWTPGPHVLTWRYEKDAAGTAGADAVYVDDLHLSGLASSVEDFESGGLGGAFTTGGDKPWIVDASGAASGTYGARSGAVTHSQASWLRYSVTNDRSAQIGFAAHAESEVNDELVVSIDGTEVQRTSGSAAWFTWGYPLPAGSHTVEWRFQRDASGSALSDAVWIDDVFVVPDPCP